MSDVFILGAGFSKAVSEEMPITSELGKLVIDRYKYKESIDPKILEILQEDAGQGFEKALAYLAQDKPWLPEAENLRHKALYLDFSNVIRALFHEMMRSPMVWRSNQPPLWLEALITHWHDDRSTVITLNYDTLIERIAGGGPYWQKRASSIPTGHLYPIPLAPAHQRVEPSPIPAAAAESETQTFKLYKLHGSTNWLYSGRSDFYGEQLYYVPCKGGIDGPFDALAGRDAEVDDWNLLSDKVPLIMPPALDKSAFFQHESLRSMWFRAGEAIRRASRVICIGYSLPISDLTMVQFLKNSAPSTPIPFLIVDLADKVQHFTRIIGNGYQFAQDQIGVDCVPKYVVNSCIANQDDRVYVLRMTPWTK